MKGKTIATVLSMILTLGLSIAALADEKLPVFKAGEAVYACACGEACDCHSMGRKPGNCSCNKPMVKATINKVEGDKALVSVNGKERVFITKAKYTCACGEGCNCGFISQKPVNCACGKPTKKVE